jgi:hypothetical protein
MDFNRMVQILNELLSKERPETFNSSWILMRAPRCYHFILKNVRTDFGAVDWDCVTRSLEWQFQRRWTPGRSRLSSVPYRNLGEVKVILEKYRTKLYVFLSPQNRTDRQIRDIISITLVRLAQYGNESAKQELINLLDFTIDNWIDQYCFLSRWRGYDEEIRVQVEKCIRRYRYSGSFLQYLFRTLEYAGRGIRPLLTYSPDKSISDDPLSRSYRIVDNQL